MTRTVDSILHESDYLIALLEDVRTLSSLIPEAAAPLPGVSVSLLEVFLGGRPDALGEGSTGLQTAMNALAEMDGPIGRILELVEGRLISLRREGGLLAEDDEG